MGGDDVENGTLEGTHAGEKFAGGDLGGAARPDPERAAKVGVTRATVEAAIGDLAASMAAPDAPEQPSLMLDEMDEQMALFSGPVKHVANIVQGARGRGRPKGSSNKNSFRDVALRMGYRHPGLNLLAIANADPVLLATELAAMEEQVFGERLRRMEVTRTELSDLVERAYGLIMKANAELLPYFEGKAAQQLDVNIRQLGVMMIGDMKTERGSDDQALDLTSVPAPE